MGVGEDACRSFFVRNYRCGFVIHFLCITDDFLGK